MKLLSFLFITLLTFSAFSQSDEEKAHNLGMQAINEMESGKIKESIKTLKKAIKLDPENIDYPYEIAYANYLDQNYKGAIKVLNGLTSHKNVNGRIWQMLGNCYDMNGQPEKAIETYDKGLEDFPKSGILYLERGNMELAEKKYNEALSYYEKGIEVQPTFSSNYYWASKIYLGTTEEVWGLIYGEIFMNLERNSKRTAEISEALFDTYKSEIKIISDSSKSVSFCQSMTMTLDDLSDPDNIKLPFCMTFEPTMSIAVALVDKIDINSLDEVRTNFVSTYFQMGHEKTYPIVIFDYQNKLKDAGHLEAYNHWILMKGDEDKFTTWMDSNKDKWDGFVSWFTENPLEINASNLFLRSQY